MTKKELIDFEDDIAQSFQEKKIRAPIHLYSNNEEEMIEIFSKVNKEDWIFCSWRSHYQCLLKGVPKETVKKAILNGKSISLCFPEYRIFSSAIVGGSLPIAVGVALDIKRSNRKEKVLVFVGDMTSETGIMWECFKYSSRYKLPIKFIIEDNNKSVCSDTRKVWNDFELCFEEVDHPMIHYYKYESKYPHAGTGGGRIQF
jgi:pyruvate dehydrogenase E1 component alpha subunit